MSAKTLVRKFFKLQRLVGNPIYARGLRNGSAAAVEHERVVRNTRIGTLVDVGANVGQFSQVARRFWPQAQIMAFEPLKTPAARYRKVFEGDTRVTLHPFAAGSEPSTAEINVAGRADSSSLLPISDLQTELHPGTQAVGKETIEVRRIDEVLAPENLAGPIFIKIDVQGFELEALRGMPKLLAAADAVYIEVSFMPLYTGQPLASEVIEHMHAAGFELTGVDNLTFSPAGTTVQADMLFRPRTRG